MTLRRRRPHVIGRLRLPISYRNHFESRERSVRRLSLKPHSRVFACRIDERRDAFREIHRLIRFGRAGSARVQVFCRKSEPYRFLTLRRTPGLKNVFARNRRFGYFRKFHRIEYRHVNQVRRIPADRSRSFRAGRLIVRKRFHAHSHLGVIDRQFHQRAKRPLRNPGFPRFGLFFDVRFCERQRNRLVRPLPRRYDEHGVLLEGTGFRRGGKFLLLDCRVVVRFRQRGSDGYRTDRFQRYENAFRLRQERRFAPHFRERVRQPPEHAFRHGHAREPFFRMRRSIRRGEFVQLNGDLEPFRKLFRRQ